MKKTLNGAYAKGLLVGVGMQNFLMIFFLTIISTPDGFELLGLTIIWTITIFFTIMVITYYYQNRDKANISQEDSKVNKEGQVA